MIIHSKEHQTVVVNDFLSHLRGVKGALAVEELVKCSNCEKEFLFSFRQVVDREKVKCKGCNTGNSLDMLYPKIKEFEDILKLANKELTAFWG